MCIRDSGVYSSCMSSIQITPCAPLLLCALFHHGPFTAAADWVGVVRKWSAPALLLLRKWIKRTHPHWLHMITRAKLYFACVRLSVRLFACLSVQLKLHLFRFVVNCCGFIFVTVHNKSTTILQLSTTNRTGGVWALLCEKLSSNSHVSEDNSVAALLPSHFCLF